MRRLAMAARVRISVTLPVECSSCLCCRVQKQRHIDRIRAMLSLLCDRSASSLYPAHVEKKLRILSDGDNALEACRPGHAAPHAVGDAAAAIGTKGRGQNSVGRAPDCATPTQGEPSAVVSSLLMHSLLPAASDFMQYPQAQSTHNRSEASTRSLAESEPGHNASDGQGRSTHSQEPLWWRPATRELGHTAPSKRKMQPGDQGQAKRQRQSIEWSTGDMIDSDGEAALQCGETEEGLTSGSWLV